MNLSAFPALRSALLAFTVVLLPLAALADHGLPADAKTVRNLAYVTDGHARQKLDLYLPAQPKGPLLVYIHGGGWRAGSKDGVPSLGFVALGYSVASVEYRFSQDAIFPAQIEDCKAAIRWLRTHAAEYGYDPKRIAAFGDSAGGHLTALLAATGNVRDFDKGENLDQSSAIQCGIDWYGPADFPGFIPPSGDPMVQREGSDSVLVQLFGGPLAEKMELARRASPVTWVTKETAPLFIEQGTKDPLVPAAQSTGLADKLKAAGVDATLEIIEGAGHGGPEFTTPDRVHRMVEFLNRHLGLGANGKS